MIFLLLVAWLQVSSASADALSYAAFQGDLRSVKYLIQEKHISPGVKTNSGWEPIHWAAAGGHLQVVKYLIQEKHISPGVKTNTGEEPIHFAADGGHLQVVKYLIQEKHISPGVKDNTGQEPIHWAAKGGQLQVVKYLIQEKHISPGVKDNTGLEPIHWAAKGGHLQVVKYLVEEQRVVVREETDNDNRSILQELLPYDAELIKYIVNALSDNKRSKLLRHTPTMLAAKVPGVTVTAYQRILAGDRATIRKRDSAGFSARDFAIASQNVQLLPLLPAEGLAHAYGNLFSSWQGMATAVACCILAGLVSVVVEAAPVERSPNVSLGAEQLAIRNTSPRFLQMFAKLYRFLETLVNAVIMMGMMGSVNVLFWLSACAAFFCLPNLALWGGRAFHNFPHMLTAMQESILLHDKRDKKMAIAASAGLLRLVAMTGLFAMARLRCHDFPWMANANGLEAASMMSSNPTSEVCINLSFVPRQTLPTWKVVNGSCSLDTAGCLQSPNFPRSYPQGPNSSCAGEILSWLPIKVVANSFNIADGDWLQADDSKFSADRPPSFMIVRKSLSWNTARDFTKERSDWLLQDGGPHGFKLCPAEEICVELMAVSSLWAGIWNACRILMVLHVAAVLINVLSLLLRGHGSQASGFVTVDDVRELTKKIEVAASQPESSQPDVAKAITLVEVEEGRFVKPVQAIEFCPPGGVYVTVALLASDFVLDLNTIHTLMLNEDYKFASLIAGTSFASTLGAIISGDLRNIRSIIANVLRTGMVSDEYRRLLRRERGLEALTSLLVSAYALPFAAKTPLKVITGVLSILSSAWGLACHIHEEVDLATTSPLLSPLSHGTSREESRQDSKSPILLDGA